MRRHSFCPFLISERTHSLRAFFDEDGRWALPVLAAYNGLAIVANGVLWGEAMASAGVGLNVCLAVLPLVAFRARRPMQEAATAAYVAIVAVGLNILLPAVY